MLIKLTGAACIVFSCGMIGFRIAAAHRHEEKTLRQLLSVLEYMESELSYHMTDLPDLCRQAVTQRSGPIQLFFMNLADELDTQISPDVASCTAICLEKQKDMPRITADMLKKLGETLGRFDLPGQIRGIKSVKEDVSRQLSLICHNKETRLRSYQTLGLCAGAAIAIMLI